MGLQQEEQPKVASEAEMGSSEVASAIQQPQDAAQHAAGASVAGQDRSSDADTATSSSQTVEGEESDTIMVESLQEAALSIQDSDAASISTLQSLPQEDDGGEQALDAGNASSLSPDASQDTRHQMDWQHFLGISGNGLNAASSATSLGFAAARSTTTFGLQVAKRFTQGLVALPAMAIDGAVMGNAPSLGNYNGQRGASGNRTPTVAEVAHAAVGGLFDVISTVAIGGINLGGAITGTGIGAAASGIEGIRRALGSEVLRSLGSFSRLVRREWSSTSEFLPPGGIPQYSIIGITQAMTAWVSIQMVTREWYERSMLKHLEPIDLSKLRDEIKALSEVDAAEESAEARSLPPRADVAQMVAATAPSPTAPSEKQRQKKRVRILEGEVLPGDEGEVIGAEIGQPSASISKVSLPSDVEHASIPVTPLPSTTVAPATPLSNAEAVHGLKRYSRLVLGVYGGVALAWLGSLPPDLMQAAGASIDQDTQQNQASASRPMRVNNGDRQASQSPAEVDEADFLRAAASLDLDDDELIDDEAASIFSADAVFVDAESSQKTSATVSGASTPVAATEDTAGPAEVRNKGSAHRQVVQSEPQVTRATAPGRSYSYYDILMGTADSDLFHQLAGLPHGAATEGDYVPADPHEENAVERLRRIKNEVARPSKPRYYVVTDHTAKKIVLVFRGSLTLGDIAIDLTCESANFDFQQGASPSPATSTEDEDDGPQPAEDFSKEAQSEREKAEAARKRETEPQARPHTRSEYIVHEGMYETAKEVGEIGRPVHRAVKRALTQYPDYDLDITGHSLGAGVAALLAIMWASPATGCTTPQSGLPVGRRMHAYCFGVPCVMGAKLGRIASPLVTSYCYSYDLVCRLSLGGILDTRNACAWLAYENSQPATDAATSRSSSAAGTASNEYYGLARPLRLTNIMQRAFVHQSGQLDAHPQQKADVEADFLALRKTLQANMRHVELYPPGTVLYSLANDDVLSNLQAPRSLSPQAEGTHRGTSDRLARTSTLYRLRDGGEDDDDSIDGARASVFGQIIYARGMLSRHMPHLYHAAIDSL